MVNIFYLNILPTILIIFIFINIINGKSLIEKLKEFFHIHHKKHKNG